MIKNSSQVSHFTLGAYFDTGPLRWLYFLIIMSVYALIVLSNLLLIVVICLNRTLHEPMYIFLCSLLLNEIYGSTSMFPFLLVQILQDIHTVSYRMCFLQIFAVYCYGNIQFMTLASMSYDRYVAICFPLQYNTRMNSRKISLLIAFSWLFPIPGIGLGIFLSISLQLCGNVIPKVYCDNYFIVKLACSDTRVNNIYGLIYLFVSIILPMLYILFTYIKILKVCFNGSKQTRQKALSTCTPHIASIVNYSFAVCFEIIQSRFDLTHVPNVLRIILSLYFLTCQPFLNPVIYGLKLHKIQVACRKMLNANYRVDHK